MIAGCRTWISGISPTWRFGDGTLPLINQIVRQSHADNWFLCISCPQSSNRYPPNLVFNHFCMGCLKIGLPQFKQMFKHWCNVEAIIGILQSNYEYNYLVWIVSHIPTLICWGKRSIATFFLLTIAYLCALSFTSLTGIIGSSKYTVNTGQNYGCHQQCDEWPSSRTIGIEWAVHCDLFCVLPLVGGQPLE